MLGEVRCDRGDQQCGDADPVLDQVGVHADIRRYLAIPIVNVLQFIEPVLQGIFEGGAVWNSLETFRCLRTMQEHMPHSDPW